MGQSHLNEPAIAAAFAKLVAFAPGFAGAVFSLAFVEKLTRRGRVVAVMAGLLSAMFIAPAICAICDLFWPGDLHGSITKAIQFLTGLCAMGCLPKLLGWLEKLAGDPLSLLKVKVGPA
ncbi:hypothetical protein [Brevundimonas sp.]|uniref:hypothetical protein n=1 Tax=Brevundimonas sp. TaxID=1871086 RepID=UPI00286B476C|nr:hypothetical protein [Brevundimonas sp.]